MARTANHHHDAISRCFRPPAVWGILEAATSAQRCLPGAQRHPRNAVLVDCTSAVISRALPGQEIITVSVVSPEPPRSCTGCAGYQARQAWLTFLLWRKIQQPPTATPITDFKCISRRGGRRHKGRWILDTHACTDRPGAHSCAKAERAPRSPLHAENGVVTSYPAPQMLNCDLRKCGKPVGGLCGVLGTVGYLWGRPASDQNFDLHRRPGNFPIGKSAQLDVADPTLQRFHWPTRTLRECFDQRSHL